VKVKFIESKTIFKYPKEKLITKIMKKLKKIFSKKEQKRNPFIKL